MASSCGTTGAYPTKLLASSMVMKCVTPTLHTCFKSTRRNCYQVSNGIISFEHKFINGIQDLRVYGLRMHVLIDREKKQCAGSVDRRVVKGRRGVGRTSVRVRNGSNGTIQLSAACSTSQARPIHCINHVGA